MIRIEVINTSTDECAIAHVLHINKDKARIDTLRKDIVIKPRHVVSFEITRWDYVEIRHEKEPSR